MSARIIDISPLIDATLGVYPGDTPFTREVIMRKADGAPSTLSSLHCTAHLGAHVDGECHYNDDGPGVDEAPLGVFAGRAQVISAEVERGGRVTADMLDGKVREERVLIRTGTFPDPHNWNDDFAGLDPTLLDVMGEAGVQLVGIDTPSVDPQGVSDFVAHQACLRNGIYILEGICLEDAQDGVYELIAMPLRLKGCDGSPVRAVLREIDGGVHGID